MLRLIAEGAGHAAAAGGDEAHVVITGQPKGIDDVRLGGKRFLEAMPVHPDLAGDIVEGVGGDATGGGLAADEFLEQQGVRGQGPGAGLLLASQQVGILIAKTEDGGGLDTDERSVGGH